MKLSIVIPVYNEKHTVAQLHERLLSVLRARGVPFEIIFVDDCSSDTTFSELKKLSPVKVVRLFRNSGQTAAISAGFQAATGDVLVTIDGDLENDPADIPRLLDKMEEGYDVVCGWRQNRWQNQKLLRRLPSLLGNAFISHASGTHIHDFACPLRVYKKDVVDRLSLMGDMHRMIAAHLARQGARVTEISISFHPRQFGTSKYGLSRTFKVLLDVFAFHFLYRYARRPIHFFGALGFVSLFLSSVAFLLMLYYKFFGGKTFIDTPLPVLAALLIIVGFQFILMGLLAELIIRMQTPPSPPVRDVFEK